MLSTTFGNSAAAYLPTSSPCQLSLWFSGLSGQRRTYMAIYGRTVRNNAWTVTGRVHLSCDGTQHALIIIWQVLYTTACIQCQGVEHARRVHATCQNQCSTAISESLVTPQSHLRRQGFCSTVGRQHVESAGNADQLGVTPIRTCATGLILQAQYERKQLPAGQAQINPSLNNHHTLQVLLISEPASLHVIHSCAATPPHHTRKFAAADWHWLYLHTRLPL
ncbi:hypothetical protein COO60DRAFT_1500496 [Scenedesmus sp. NREL 46B-D3]|nr:hypothetical protein COO60DRAFT_1500496 [Scenedesmus sp. NREL 46B-D3]